MVLQVDLWTSPDSLAIRFENKFVAIESKLDRIQTTVTDHEQHISDLESGFYQLQTLVSMLNIFSQWQHQAEG